MLYICKDGLPVLFFQCNQKLIVIITLLKTVGKLEPEMFL